MDEELRAELLARRDEDQRIRAQVPPGPSAPDPDLLAEWPRVDKSNTRWLTELTKRIGWPTAILHTPSGENKGQFTLTVRTGPVRRRCRGRPLPGRASCGGR